ncbi:MAG: Gfo/Idh/MocA family oxidoreductase [Rhizobium sp.]|nr:Gfo/Idh/MocA family oxidoreductase [Rhizobium sp.]
MRILIIGNGSIGNRHARLLASVGHEIAVLSARPVEDHRGFTSLKEALTDFLPDFVIVASVTSRHGADLNALSELGYSKPVLVEKPLLETIPKGGVKKPHLPVQVAYNLRFHPVVIALRKALEGRTILAAHIIAGQHLSQWRPGRDMLSTYSASKAAGGGVVRDLSHELDLAQYVLGPLSLITSHSARVGNVTVDSEDIAAAILSSTSCPLITIHLNYLDRQPRRHWLVITETGTIEADLIKSTLTIDGKVETVPLAPDQTYKRMHQAVLAGEPGPCSWEEGIAAVALADRIAPL